jgi:DNA-binding transcriptional ArsR family regulator
MVMTTPEHSVAYLRFLSLLDAIRGDPSLPELEANERELLDMLAMRWFSGRKVCVLEAMNSGVSGMSPSTVHRRIKSLKGSGMIRIEQDGHDSRTKYLVPTDQALRYFDRLGECLERSGDASQAA